MKPLNLILVSGRHFDVEQRREALARDRCLVMELAGRGCEVRWMVPAADDGGSDESVAGNVAGNVAVNGVSVLPVHTTLPGFRSVLRRLNDPPLEQRLSRCIRDDLPDVVHALAYGAGTSINVAWLAGRLGVPSVVTVRSREALCHRGTLINERGETCREWHRPERCAECCLTPVAEGLGPVAAACGRVLARLRWVSPFPQGVDFENRLELAPAGLIAADRVLVAASEDARLLEEAGVKGVVVLVDDHDAGALLEVYRAVYRAVQRAVRS